MVLSSLDCSKQNYFYYRGFMENSILNRYALFTKMISIGKSMRLHCHKAIEADGFSLNETDVLLSLACGNCTVKEISAWANMTKGNISTAIDSLKKKGFVTTKTSSVDRRSTKITLEKKAEAVLEKLKNAESEYFERFMVALPNDDSALVNRIFGFMQKLSLPSFLEKLSKKDSEHEKK